MGGSFKSQLCGRRWRLVSIFYIIFIIVYAIIFILLYYQSFFFCTFFTNIYILIHLIKLTYFFIRLIWGWIIYWSLWTIITACTRCIIQRDQLIKLFIIDNENTSIFSFYHMLFHFLFLGFRVFVIFLYLFLNLILILV